MVYYERKLPHWHPKNTYIFITWRLAGSVARVTMPGKYIARAGTRFLLLDREADKADCGPVWLNDPRIAAIVESTIVAGERERAFYDLAAYVIMPNHVHLAILPRIEVPVITRWLKGSTARHANQILGRTGQPFWHQESFDHWIRPQAELQKIVRYIEQNPVSAGLVKSPVDWPWSSAKE